MDWRHHLLKRTGYCSYSKATSGKTLEFIGTSGIGKTTLFNESLSRIKSRWLFSYQLGFFNRKVESRDIDECLMKILQGRVEKIYRSDTFCPWHSLLDLELCVKVMHETVLATRDAYPKGIAFEEGLFRHFPAEILELFDEFPIQLWENRAFVYVRARSTETALERLKSRRKQDAQVESQRVVSDDQLLARITQDQEMFQSIVDTAQSFGCPVLVIEAEDSFRDSLGKILEFESSLSQRFKMQKKIATTPNSVA